MCHSEAYAKSPKEPLKYLVRRNMNPFLTWGGTTVARCKVHSFRFSYQRSQDIQQNESAVINILLSDSWKIHINHKNTDSTEAKYIKWHWHKTNSIVRAYCPIVKTVRRYTGQIFGESYRTTLKITRLLSITKFTRRSSKKLIIRGKEHGSKRTLRS